MRFRGTVEFCVDVSNLDLAAQVMRTVEQAAHEARGAGSAVQSGCPGIGGTVSP
jgi:hypothetical protein